MPHRPRSHQIEDESRLAFAQALGPRYLFRSEDRDYGIDGEVEEFDEDDLATGLRYLVQLKATDENELSDALRVTLSVETASYYGSLSQPVLMVRYLSHDERLYVRWFHNNAFEPTSEGAKSLTFRWTEDDLWDEDTPARLAAEAKAFLELRSSAVELPIEFALTAADEVLGLTRTEVSLAVRDALTSRPDVIKLVPESDVGTAAFGVTDSMLTVEIPGSPSTAFDLPAGYQPGPSGAQVAADLLTLAAAALSDWGQADLAGRLASSYFASSSLAGDGETAARLSSAMARARQVRDALDLSEALDASASVAAQETSVFFTLVAMHHALSLNNQEISRYREVLTRRIERRVESDELRSAAGNCVSLANNYRVRAEPQLAVGWYERALELDPEYARRTHFWLEFAGVLFGSHAYTDAAAAYWSAVELGADEIAYYLHVDSLLFAGQYEAARDSLQEVPDESVAFGVGAEFGLKEELLESVVDELGISSQDRKPQEAATHADIRELAARMPSEVPSQLMDALAMDALCGLAWWNLAHHARAEGDEELASRRFLNAALCNEGDVEAWANATVGAWWHGEITFVPAIVVTGQRMTGALLPRLGEIAREQGADFPRARFMEFLDEMVTALSDEPEVGYSVRVLGPDGAVTTIQLPAA